MCQLFAMNSNTPVSVNLTLTAFTARGGRTGDHVDGWGIAFHEGRRSRVFIDNSRAADSALAAFLCLYPIHATTVLAHVRKATHGVVDLVNCHPFQREWRGRLWSFSHNGKLIDFAPALAGDYLPIGDTDSERAFCWIMEQLRRRSPRQTDLDWQQIALLLTELAEEIGRHGEFNFTLTDGDALYAFGATRLAWVQRKAPFVPVQFEGHELNLDLGGVHGPGERIVHVATEPLTQGEYWQAFQPSELKVFMQGEEVWSRCLHAPVLDQRGALMRAAA